MTIREAKPDRLPAFSDGVFAVIITILVLDLNPPESPRLAALLSHWPTGLSHAVSYLFIAVVWVNHHHVLRYPEVAKPRLIWGNFAHLFSISRSLPAQRRERQVPSWNSTHPSKLSPLQ